MPSPMEERRAQPYLPTVTRNITISTETERPYYRRHRSSLPKPQDNPLEDSQPCIASPGLGAGSNEPLAFPISQSVSVTNLAVRSHPLASSACSIVWDAILPSSSKEKMNSPVNCSSLESLKIGASPPRSTLRLRLMPGFEDEDATRDWLVSPEEEEVDD